MRNHSDDSLVRRFRDKLDSPDLWGVLWNRLWDRLRDNLGSQLDGHLLYRIKSKLKEDMSHE